MFQFIKKFGKPDGKGVVVLVHGLLHRGISFYFFAAFLARRGYLVYVYDYASTRESLPKLGWRLGKFLVNLRTKLPENVELNVITHSMGALLVRWALADFPEVGVKRCVMLAPPHHGSPVADYFLNKWKFSSFLVKSLPGLATTYKDVPPMAPGVVFGIIAAQYDKKVPFESTELAGMKERVCIPIGHTAILHSRQSMRLALHFIEHGTFVLKKSDHGETAE